VLYTVITLFLHPGGGPTEEANFAINAASGAWTAIHLGQFVGMAVSLAGLLVLYFALNVSQGTPRWLGFFGAMAAGVAIALAGVQYALDGVANKQAEVAWVSAGASEKAARFASAQALRWLEWGITSYQLFMLGLALVLLGIVIVWTARVTRPIGSLMGVSGLAWLVLGWVIGTQGFTSAQNVPAGAGLLLLLASSIWLYIVAWWRKETVQAVPA
jgi:hypothetical protein